MISYNNLLTEFWLLLLHSTSMAEVSVSEGQAVCLVSVERACLLDELLQVTLPQLLIKHLNQLPSVL